MPNSPTRPPLARFLVETLAAAGVKHLFGVPGGGSSLDVIAAGADRGLDFVLTGTETAGGIMAAVTGELTGTAGVLLTGIGPGAASAVNAVAYASLEKAPLLVITDTRAPLPGTSEHQLIDQGALYAPLARFSRRLEAEDADTTLAAALAAALGHPRGPAHLDISGEDATAPVAASAMPPALPPLPAAPERKALNQVRTLLAKSQYPVILAGHETRAPGAAATLGHLAETLSAPVMTSYKAKGVFADDHPLCAGLTTGAAAEARMLRQGDLIVLFGFDPIEFIPQPWRYDAPVAALASGPLAGLPMKPAATAWGDLAAAGRALAATAVRSAWTPEQIHVFRETADAALDVPCDGLSAAALTRAVQAAFPRGTRAAVDAGAHMFAAMAFWRAEAPHEVLKSNGLSTMGFALPAAIASALVEPDRSVVALTGDGGMSMMLAELSTLVRLGLPVKVIVYNDARLSLIDVKQQRRQEPPRGTRYPHADFAAVAEGLGVKGFRAGPAAADLEATLARAAAHSGPALVDVTIDPSGYPAQLEALRG